MLCVLLAQNSPSAAQPTSDANVQPERKILAAEDAIVLPEPIDDPLEPVNRGLWSLNQGLLKFAIQPSSKVYRAVVPGDVRRGIRNAGRNLAYPRDLLNNLMQQKWTGARDETYRFLLNSVAGIGGLFDVATDARIPASDTDFGLTLREWGWTPRIYLMLPITGPSNERDAIGGFVDRWVNPITYFPPYSYIHLGVTYNNLTETVDEYIRVAKAGYDPYYMLRYAWIVAREAGPVNLALEGEPDRASLETLRSVFFKVRNSKFPERGGKWNIAIPGTGRELPFTVWLQDGTAPVVYIVPGFGSHRLGGSTLALAEVLFDAGFSVVSMSNAFNYEFMERAATTVLPGYTPRDARDVHVALTGMDGELRAKHGDHITGRALLGYSMGGFHSLYLAGIEATNDPALVKFDRYVAVDVPVRLDRAIETLDDHFRAALEWPADTRTERIEDTFVKVAGMVRQLSTLTPQSEIPLNATESKFLVGLAFRLSLRDVIFLSQTRTNMGVVEAPINPWRREEAYREILQYSFAEYLEKFVIPYYQRRGVDLSDPEEFARAVDLRQFEEVFTGNPKVRVVANENDLLLAEEDVAWLRATFGHGRLTLFPGGGHLGNLNETVVQREIVRTLADMLPRGGEY